jgi:hypothetical protein
MTTQTIKRGVFVVFVALLVGFALANRTTSSAAGASVSNEAATTDEARALLSPAHAQSSEASETFAALYASLSKNAARTGDDKAAAAMRALSALPATAAQGPQGERPVEERQKNIQVLKGLPSNQLFPVMNLMRASLGVGCIYCHVNAGGDKWEWEKDDKPEKQTARKMIQMTMDINKNNFGGRPAISCYTCHRAAEHPVGIPPLPQTPPEGGPAGEHHEAREAMPTVDQVLDKYVQAIGGAAAYQKLKTRTERGVQIVSGGVSIPVEVYQSAPNKLVSIMTTPKQGVMSSGYNGTTAWMRNQRGQRELAGAQLEQSRRAADFYADLHLKDLYPKLAVRGKEKIGDREAYILVSPVNEQRTERLYFDTQTGLLLRILALTNTPVGRLPEQTDFSDYRDVDGIKLPFTIQQSFVDPWVGWTRKLTEIKHNVKIDDTKFNPPPAPPAAKP